MPVFAPGTSILTPMPLTVHRFEQTIGSQHYVVEVRPALRGWRACLAHRLADRWQLVFHSVSFLSLLSHIFSATAASEGLGNPVARAS